MTDTSTTPIENETIKTLLNRRSIRKFKPEAIDPEVVATIEEAAQRAPSSQYLNDWSAIRVKSQELKETIAKIGHQPYIAEAPLLYIFIADQHRNAAIAKRKGVDVHSDEFTLNSNYRFTQAQNDAVLALHAMETAANGLGLGCVVLGSVLNDQAELIKLLHLPEFTYPILGLAIGKPDQAPALKPRMDRSAQFFDDAYPADDSEFTSGLDAFDETVHRYYDLRNTERPVDAFSDQITKNATDSGVFSRNAKSLVESQGFRYDR